ncbi:hypothetical protein DF186_16215, partial [Enterococcus hirae]
MDGQRLLLLVHRLGQRRPAGHLQLVVDAVQTEDLAVVDGVVVDHRGHVDGAAGVPHELRQ